MNKACICGEGTSEPRLIIIDIVFDQVSLKLDVNRFFPKFRNNTQNANRSIISDIRITVFLV